MHSQRSTQQWQTLDSNHYRHPFTDHGELHAMGSRIITKADGIYIWDSEGRQFLDGMAGLWCVNVGYGRQRLVDAATKQMQQLAYYNSFFQCAHPAAIELSSELVKLSQPHFNEVFFTNSGSESNDTIIRMARYYWQLKGQPNKQIFISRKNGYHGSTVGGASLGGMSVMHHQGGLPIPGIVHIDQPYWFGEGQGMDENEFGIKVAQTLEQEILKQGVDNVAAFIAEPIQGAGGVIIPPDSYWPEIKRICNQYDILLVCDEVICGFGRLGSWFGSDHYDVQPDLMPIAKGLSSGYMPIGGVMIADRVAKVLTEHGGEFFHGFTYSGHPVACAVALENLRIIQEENLVAYVRDDIGPYFKAQWDQLGEHPVVAQSRCQGLIGALEIVRPSSVNEKYSGLGERGVLCRGHCLAQNMIMRATGDTMIISPPLVITKAEVDDMIIRITKALDATHASLR